MSTDTEQPREATPAEREQFRQQDEHGRRVDALVLEYQPLLLVVLDGDSAWEHTFPEGNTGMVIGVGDASWIAARALAEYIEVRRVLADTETRTEWGVRYPNPHPEPVYVTDEKMARHVVATVEGSLAFRRTVHTGPWQPADTNRSAQ